MAFITHFFKKCKETKYFGILLAGLLLSTIAYSTTIQNQFIDARYTNQALFIDARYKITLNSTLQEALTNGVSLPFRCEIEIIRPRWYALYHDVFGDKLEQNYRLSFHALTRQYRLGQGSYYRSFPSLDEALNALGIFHNWQVMEVDSDRNLSARIRMRLDISQLPKPYQITTLGNTQWSLVSDWVEFQPHLVDDKEAQ